MADDDEVACLWSGVPTRHVDVPVITLDSPPESPPQDDKGALPACSAVPLMSIPIAPTFGFKHINLTKYIPPEVPATPEDSGHEEEKQKPPEPKMKNKKRKKRKKNKNPILVEKMIDQIKEAGILEKFKEEEQKALASQASVQPKPKWTRYFEAEVGSSTSSEAFKFPEKEEPPVLITARDIRKAAERAERHGRIQRGRVTKLSRNRGRPVVKSRCFNCHQWGHMKFECPDPIKPIKCHMCASEGHTSETCPRSMCLQCGHKAYSFVSGCRFCNQKWNLRCARCNGQGHETQTCPDLWRRFYSTVSGNGEVVAPSTIVGTSSLKPSHKLFCCNCAKRGHSVDHCPKSRDNFCGNSFISSSLGLNDFGRKEKTPKNQIKEAWGDLYKGSKALKRFKRDLMS